MNGDRPKRKILLFLTCAVALLAVGPVAVAVGGDEMESEPQSAAVAAGPVEEAVADETTDLHAQVVRGLPFSNFDLFVLIVVVLGLSTITLVVHRLNRDPGEPPVQAPVTTDAE